MSSFQQQKMRCAKKKKCNPYTQEKQLSIEPVLEEA